MKSSHLLSLIALSSLVLVGCTSNMVNPVGSNSQQIQSGAVIDGNYIGESILNFGKETQPSLKFNLSMGDTINLTIEQPSDQTVLRLSHVVYPDKTTDGPFSAETSFIASLDGEYEFVFGPNLMASNEPYTGDAKVTIDIQRNK
jgi:hypothetical protein